MKGNHLRVKHRKLIAFDLSPLKFPLVGFLFDRYRTTKKHKHTSDDGMREHRYLHNTSAWNEQFMH